MPTKKNAKPEEGKKKAKITVKDLDLVKKNGSKTEKDPRGGGWHYGAR